MQVRSIHVYLLIILTVGLLVFISWTIDRKGVRAASVEVVRLQGQAVFQLLDVVRIWGDRRGIYSEDKSDPSSRNSTNGDETPRKFTRINSAHMTKEIGTLLADQGTNIIFSSLKPLNPDNAPDEWTRRSLLAFESGSTEAVEVFNEEYRYMAPLYVEESCMECHSHQGYELGNVRGGLGFVFSKDKIESILWSLHQHTDRAHVIAFIVLSLFFILIHALVNHFKGTIFQVKQLNKELSEKVNKDLLTGVLSRDAIFHRIEHECNRFQRDDLSMSLMMLDLDHFKEVNDTYGHLMGDEVLQAVADIVSSQLRDIDDMGRYGGEEFIVLLADTDQHTTELVADRILNAIRDARIQVSTGDEIPITISIGFSVVNYEEKIPVKALIDRADKALYVAKNEGRNCVRSWLGE